ncbi:MAG: hypothetical protein IJ529_03820, partial [Alphaproteobacteria bacterium]|nr:hypothetical protein [Alphaproteobacteria bacterium]
ESVMLEPAVINIREDVNDLRIVRSYLSGSELVDGSSNGDYIQVFRRRFVYNVEYNHFKIFIPMYLFEAYYDDGVLARKFPGFEFQNISCPKPELVYENSGEDENGKYRVYWLTQRVTVNIDELVCEYAGTAQLIAYE